MDTEKLKEKFLDKIIDFIEALPMEEKPYFAEDVCFIAAVHGGNSDHESFGIIECAKHELHKSFDKELNEAIAEKMDDDLDKAVMAELKLHPPLSVKK